MPMSAEARAAASERMKAMLAKKRAAKAAALPADPAVREAMAKTTSVTIPRGQGIDTSRYLPGEVIVYEGDKPPQTRGGLPNQIKIDVDWEQTPIAQAQQFYAHLKAEFEKAGKILNARSMAHLDGYTCFMCKKHFAGNPGFTDYSYIDQATGLSPRVDCCGELCVINYHKMRIDMRTAKNIDQAAAERGE